MGEQIKIVILGDICPTEDYRQAFDAGAERLFGNALQLIRQADLALCNLECPATDCTNAIEKTGPNLRAQPQDLQLLAQAGFHAISLANNHILDYGEAGVLDTLSAAQACNLHVFGAGKNSSEAAKPAYFTIKGKTIGFMSFAEHEFNLASADSAGANGFDPYVSLQKIAQAKANCDCLILLYHGGIEHYPYPSPLLQKKCHAMADAGADLVLCQHSHCIGTLETYHHTPILYGQGNAVFGYRSGNPCWNESLAALVTLDGDTQSLHFEVLCAKPDSIALADDAIRDARIAQLQKDSAKISEPAFVAAQWAAYAAENRAWYLPMLFAWGRAANKLNRIAHNKLVRLIIPRRRLLVPMNLIHCDAHRELLETMLEHSFD